MIPNAPLSSWLRALTVVVSLWPRINAVPLEQSSSNLDFNPELSSTAEVVTLPNQAIGPLQNTGQIGGERGGIALDGTGATFYEVCGFTHGSSFDDFDESIANHRRLSQITIWTDGVQQDWISGLEMHYEGDAGEDIILRHGTTTGVNPRRLYLESGETVDRVHVACGRARIKFNTAVHARVFYMSFTTSSGRVLERGNYGSSEDHHIWTCFNCKLAGFYGHSGSAIDGIASRWLPKDKKKQISFYPEDHPTLQVEEAEKHGIAARGLVEKDDSRSESNTRVVGPDGGPHGYPWSDRDMIGTTHRRIASVSLWCGERVDAIQFGYRDNRDPTGVASFRWGYLHGNKESSKSPVAPKAPIRASQTYHLHPNEYIVSVQIDPTYADRGIFRSSRTRISYLKFTTNLDHSVECGTPHTSVNMNFWNMPGYALLYCFGSSGAQLDNLGGLFIPHKDYF